MKSYQCHYQVLNSVSVSEFADGSGIYFALIRAASAGGASTCSCSCHSESSAITSISLAFSVEIDCDGEPVTDSIRDKLTELGIKFVSDERLVEL